MRAFARFAFVIVLSLFLTACAQSDAADTSGGEGAMIPVETVSLVDGGSFTAMIDGQAWTGAADAASFGWFPNGMPESESTASALQMVFNSTVPGDERQLTIWVSAYPMQVGIVPVENVEVSLAGSHAGGDGHYGFSAQTGHDLQLEIVLWEATESGNYLISGTLGGTLTMASDTSTVIVENGLFENVEVPVR